MFQFYIYYSEFKLRLWGFTYEFVNEVFNYSLLLTSIHAF